MSAQGWDDHAVTFDDEADHGLRDPNVREAWRELVLDVAPRPPAVTVDLGCGTGSLSLLLAEAGLTVHGLDLSPAMVEVATMKIRAAGPAVEALVDLRVGDAADPPHERASVDLLVARHVLWVFDDPDAVLARWVSLLAPGGAMLLVEGRWGGIGTTAQECRDLVLRHREQAEAQVLDDERYWGRPIDDERYRVVSTS